MSFLAENLICRERVTQSRTCFCQEVFINIFHLNDFKKKAAAALQLKEAHKCVQLEEMQQLEFRY